MKKHATKAKARSKGKKRPSRSKTRSGPAKGRAPSPKAKTSKSRVAKRRSKPARGGRSKQAARPRRVQGIEEAGRLTPLHDELIRHHESSPVLSAGDVDADWTDAEGSGEESVGGSVPTPDQDVVDEIGRALGVEQALTQPVTSSEEILRERAQHRWEIERKASEEEDRHER